MSNYIQQEFDFIERTKEILSQYNSLNIKEKFSVTLLLNCSVGLLVLPQQFWFDHLPTEIISREKWGLTEDMITFMENDKDKSVKNIARHLRNSISHYKFETIPDANNKIDKIKFSDSNSKNNKVFEMIISVKDYILFLQKFSSEILELVKSLK